MARDNTSPMSCSSKVAQSFWPNRLLTDPCM
jgi:hypothetical protein